MKKTTISGPFHSFSSPYGKATLFRNEWYVSLEETDKCIGKITQYEGQEVFVISNSWPVERFPTFEETVARLVEMNEENYVFPS